MIPPEKITDTQIGVATWMFLWCIVLGYAGSFVTMGLHQHADWWNLVPYTGTRAPLPHTDMFPVRKRKNPQKPQLSNEQQRSNDTYFKALKMSKTVLLPSDLQNGYLANLSRPRRSPCILSVDKSHEWTVKRSIRCAHASGDARGPRSAPYHQETCIRAQRWLVNSAMTQTPVKPADSPSTQIGTLSAKPATRLTVGHGPPDDESTIDRVRTAQASKSDSKL